MNCNFIHTRNNGHSGGGGGNKLTSANRIMVRRTLAIGDSLCATVVADRLISLGYEVVWQTHPAIHCVIRRHPTIAAVEAPGSFTDVDLDGAYETDPNRRSKHFHQMFFERANAQLSRYGILLGEARNCIPRIVMPHCDKEAARARWEQYPRPWIGVVPRSETYNVRQVHDGTWAEAARQMPGTKFWIARHPAPPGFVDLHAQHFDHVILWCSVLDLLVTVDTGPMHVAAALGTPVLAMSQSSSPELHLGDQVDWTAVAPPLDCLNCQVNVCPKNSQMPPCQNIDPGLIASWATAKLRPLTHDGVSAVVCIYQPDAGTLRHCLDNLLPQVDEIVVSAEGNSRIPKDRLEHPKIKYVQKGLAGIGYGRNANFGARHSTHRYLLFLNDDVFLDPGAVQKMREVCGPQVGIVSNLLRYPEGTIYHSGKIRAPGVRGWGHLNHRQMHPYYSQPAEQENTCMACALVRREAFYQINGFDEDYFLFAEDDDFCLRTRRAGWKIIFTPHSTGIHMEHQSVTKIADLGTSLQRANAIFDRKWGAYLTHNIDKVPGDFDY